MYIRVFVYVFHVPPDNKKNELEEERYKKNDEEKNGKAKTNKQFTIHYDTILIFHLSISHRVV